MKSSRRNFLKALGLSVATGLAGCTTKSEASDKEALPAPKRGKKKSPYRWGMVIDLDKCTGCEACLVACKVENNIPVANPEETSEGRSIDWMDRIQKVEGTFPNNKRTFVPTPCNHCSDAPCVKVCPVGATYITEDGLVAQIYSQCIGCRYCTVACPYNRRYFNWSLPQWTEDLVQQLNPDVPVRPEGVVEKCTFCVHRIQKGKDKAKAQDRLVRDGEITTACQDSCPTEAIAFGNLNDEKSLVARLSKSSRAYRPKEELGTNPKVYYLSERDEA